ncbi:hypothetical protein H7E67_02915 [Clostridium gasigenes]|uniref:DUF7309 domain-containing protein n=1 Tax=Clostridium gasigenes TaxID=94869 RepID=UPI0016232618|nr:hypothetical protein [Clostridium gasigenes]MBB6622374.1 hypothetical protein [Clostridium gasigenes]
MRKEANLAQWEELYKVAIRIKEMKPWEELWDMDLITILQSEEDEPCCCSVMGKGGECYGIGAYIGINAIHNFFVMANSSEVPPHQLIRYQNNTLCNFGNREELTKKELTIIKDLGLKFRGKNNWIYFRVFEKGYAPYMPSEEEVLELTNILKHLFMAIKALHNGVKVDFEGGNTLVRRFDNERNLWINYEEHVFIPEVKYPVPVLEDEILMGRLKNQKKNNSILELDTVFLNGTINDRNYIKPLVPVLCVLAESRSGMLISQEMITPDDEEIQVIFGTIINYIMQYGKPKKILVRDMHIFSILMDMCKKMEVDLIIKGNLKAIDDFVESFTM